MEMLSEQTSNAPGAELSHLQFNSSIKIRLSQKVIEKQRFYDSPMCTDICSPAVLMDIPFRGYYLTSTLITLILFFFPLLLSLFCPLHFINFSLSE